jgi:fibronectin type 3 domain-containing protein
MDKPDKKIAYQYKLVAEDSARLATSSQLFTAKVLQANAHPAITKIKPSADRTEKKIRLVWEYNEPNVVKYVVYRAEADESLSLYGTVAGNAAGFADTQVKINTAYKYRVKAIFKDGRESGFSDEIKISY